MSETMNAESDKSNLLIAVVQGQDSDMAIENLVEAGLPVTRLPSVGGFLGRKRQYSSDSARLLLWSAQT